MRLHRRQFLQALGLGAASTLISGDPLAHADGVDPPTRIVFFVTPHGHIPMAWKMAIPSGPTDAFAERSLVGLAPSEVLSLIHI